jgi:hypothetical protein
MLPGQKAKILTLLDHAASDELVTLYTIELVLMKSPEKKAKCGAIVVFKMNDLDSMGMGFKEGADPREVFEAKKHLNEMTEVMYKDPEYFKESEGRWIPWAINRVLDVYDDIGGSADILIKCPRLRIRQKVSSREVANGRSDLKKLFWTAWDIDRLLDKDYKYDPWLKEIRRGKIGAEFIKSRK